MSALPSLGTAPALPGNRQPRPSPADPCVRCVWTEWSGTPGRAPTAAWLGKRPPGRSGPLRLWARPEHLWAPKMPGLGPGVIQVGLTHQTGLDGQKWVTQSGEGVCAGPSGCFPLWLRPSLGASGCRGLGRGVGLSFPASLPLLYVVTGFL